MLHQEKLVLKALLQRLSMWAFIGVEGTAPDGIAKGSTVNKLMAIVRWREGPMITVWRQVMSTDETKTKSWIQTSAGVCGGEPCIRNTRHTVSGLVEWKKSGLSDHRILEHHPDLTPADLEVAWAYYASHRKDIERLLQDLEAS